MDGKGGLVVTAIIIVLCVVIGLFVFVAAGLDAKAAEMGGQKGASQ